MSYTYDLDLDEHLSRLLDGPFPLHQAAREGHDELLRLLLEEGIHLVNEINYDRVTPLHEACLAGRFASIKTLLEYGANVNSRNIDGSTPLCDASASGSVECIKFLLQHGADVNPTLLLSTPLHEAALRGHTESLHILIEAGANLDPYDCHFGTPLHIACSRPDPNIELIHTLLSAGANVNATKIHRSPLHCCAVASNNSELAELLIWYGANVYLKDNQGYTARQLCQPSSKLCHILEHYETHPRSLKDQCRLMIRKNLKKWGVIDLNVLELPRCLIYYLQ